MFSLKKNDTCFAQLNSLKVCLGNCLEVLASVHFAMCLSTIELCRSGEGQKISALGQRQKLVPSQLGDGAAHERQHARTRSSAAGISQHPLSLMVLVQFSTGEARANYTQFIELFKAILNN